VLLHVWVYSSPIWGGKSSSQSMTSSSSRITVNQSERSFRLVQQIKKREN
jgi:hypothetical protein